METFKPTQQVKELVMDLALVGVRLSPESLEKLVEYAHDLYKAEWGKAHPTKKVSLTVVSMKTYQGGGQ